MMMHRSSIIATFVGLLCTRSVLSTPGRYRAPVKGLVDGNTADQDVNVGARDLGLNGLSPVLGVVELLMSLHYEYWCTEFLPYWPTPSEYIVTTATETGTKVVGGESTVTVGGKIMVTSGVGSVTETTTRTVEETSTTTTTTTTTPPSLALRDVEIPEFLDGYDQKIIFSACSLVLQPSPRATTTTRVVYVTSNLSTKTTTLYTTTAIIPSKTTTVTTTSTIITTIPEVATVTVKANAD